MASYDQITRARYVPIESVLAARGHHLRRSGGELIGPCLVCGGTDRFGVNIRKQVWNCRGCGKGGDVITLVRHLDGCGFNDAIEQLTGEKSAGRNGTAWSNSPPGPSPFDPIRHAKARAEDAEHERQQHRKAAWLWSQRQPIQGTVAETYLRGEGADQRAITCPLPPTLAFLPPSKPGHHPAMIAAFSLPDEPEPGVLGEPRNVEAVHLTLLKPDGSDKADVKPNKITVGSPGNLPIVLAPPTDLLGMAITEGIEDALTVHQALGLGAWAAGSAPRMPALADTLPEYIECVTVFAHDDGGRAYALALADALDRRGVEVFIEGIEP